ncbi:hypothetical protein [Streptomyces sp. NPDC052107]|uniref:hypothetical protein n=1 Tax=Streptomyces sp. NPDC052107 TaxID=3155632 RepID=UPI003426E306
MVAVLGEGHGDLGSADLGVGPEVLKKGASDILDCRTPMERVDLKDPAGQGFSFGDDSAAPALVTFCATWQLGAQFLADGGATLTGGLNKANNNYAETNEAIRDAANSVKLDLSLDGESALRRTQVAP